MVAEPQQTDVGAPAWLPVSGEARLAPAEHTLRPHRIYARVVAATALVALAVGVLGAVASRQVAEREAVLDAAQRADIIARIVVQPALRDEILTQQPAAVARLDRAVREHVLGSDIIRVKFWSSDGRIVYSDESRLVGETFGLSQDELMVLQGGPTRAEVTDLQEPENRFERGQGKLLEVYRPVRTPGGEALLFETYAPYSAVNARTGSLWLGFAGITISSLLVLVLLMLPVLWRLLDRLNRAQEQRQALLERAVEASAEERRRIAATLHDGVVQELVAASFAVSGAAVQARSQGKPELAGSLEAAAGTVRTGIGGLRSLLVDIYPPSLDSTGLVSALRDLVASSGSRDIAVRLLLEAPEPTGVDKDQERLVFSIAQECLRNAVRHSGSTEVTLSLATDQEELVLEVIDAGSGFDVAAVLDQPAAGHFGLQLMADAAARASGRLSVASAPGWGTHWRLRVPKT